MSKQVMHAIDRVGDRHRPEGVAVVAVGNGENALALWLIFGLPVLQRHLQRDLDRYGARVSKENSFQARRGQIQQMRA